MKLDDVKASGIEDRRGGAGRLPGGKAAKVGVPGVIIAVIIAIVSQAGGGGGGGTGDAVGQILGQLAQGGTSATASVPETQGNSLQGQEKFAGQMQTLLDGYWKPVLAASDEKFEAPTIVVFDGPTQTGGCGVGQPEAGPFYCPGDEKIYLDFAFYEQLEKQLGFDGDFAMAYVIAHEYGHHVQNLLGINEQVRKESDGASEADANALSVKLELQADCFAGVWAKSASDDGRLDAGDFDEAIDAAAAVGDDAIQGRGASRESFTHGSSAERQQWFKTGFDSADASQCDTFG
ncbi:neutral zinc metallopeptidase [Aquihabitans sp. G128]|uniref:KPN_02809 family neutral zinc metallopeptidase n=1 Tax=Aquihabitans sp. G128 TaxID=2849779 RepID=UPI001C22976A|nr:neutral zinc metallopeptidase [Aquihabitans sp. G128]QXC63033.1 neutral zinc metallopeptidase [Aquihabitans sp. G128]